MQHPIQEEVKGNNINNLKFKISNKTNKAIIAESKGQYTSNNLAKRKIIGNTANNPKPSQINAKSSKFSSKNNRNGIHNNKPNRNLKSPDLQIRTSASLSPQIRQVFTPQTNTMKREKYAVLVSVSNSRWHLKRKTTNQRKSQNINSSSELEDKRIYFSSENFFSNYLKENQAISEELPVRGEFIKNNYRLLLNNYFS